MSAFINRSQRPIFLLLLIAVIMLGLFVRLDFLSDGNFGIDADEAIVGLMAKHILETGILPVFYYGQHYMGSLEAIVVAVFSWLFNQGVVSNYSLKAAPLFFFVLFILLIYAFTVELVACGASRQQTNWRRARLTGLLAAFYTAISPVAFIIWSTKARGGFIEVITLGIFAFYLLVRAINLDRVNAVTVANISLILGIGWWVNNQIIYFMLPVFIVTAVYSLVNFRLKKTLLLLGLAVLAWLLGGLPFWIYNLSADFASFALFKSTGSGSFGEQLGGLAQNSLPILFGARRFWTLDDNFVGAATLVDICYGILTLGAVYSLFESGPGRVLSGYLKPSLLISFVLCVAVIFSASSFGYLSQAPRYLLPFYVAIFPLTAIGLSFVAQRVSLVLAVVIGIFLLMVNSVSAYYPQRQHQGQPFIFEQSRVSEDHQVLISWLAAHKIKLVRTNYWIGYRLAFETQEQVKFLVYGRPQTVRIAAYESLKNSVNHDLIPYILVPSEARLILSALDLQGYQYQTAQVSGYIVIYDLNRDRSDHRPLAPGQFKILASDQQGSAANISDLNLRTRWGSGRPQADNMRITFELEAPTLLNGLNLYQGEWKTDFPRGLEVRALKPDGQWIKLINKADYQALKYFLENVDELKLSFPPTEVTAVRLRQSGSDSFFDWSIAEVELLEAIAPGVVN